MTKKTTMTKKRQRFVSEYLLDHNATQAAIRAGYSEASAGSIGHFLLKEPEISSAIAAADTAYLERMDYLRGLVFTKLEEILSSEASDLPGSPLLVKNKLRAIELLCKALGLYKDQTDLSGSVRFELLNGADELGG